MLKTTLLFFATALAEIIGCFLPYLWLKKQGSLAIAAGGIEPDAVCLAVDAASGGQRAGLRGLWRRVCGDSAAVAAGGGRGEAVRAGLVGAGVALVGMLIIVSGWRAA